MVIKIILWIVVLFVLFQIVVRIFRKLVHFPAPAFIDYLLDSSFRKRSQPPITVIERSGIKEGMHVLDLGCGSGVVAAVAAKIVGEKGKIYALDIQPQMLRKFEHKLSMPENKDIKNIELINKSAYELPFNDNTLDAIYMVAVLGEIPDRNRALAQIKRVLKPDGILAVSEILPDPDYALMSTTIRHLTTAGFNFEAKAGNFWNYTVRFRKPS
jgi:ubiquinone/menaquinone biosynthesis C-methylase UbiE